MSESRVKIRKTLGIFNDYEKIYYILFFIVFAVVMALCPYSADDVYYKYLDFNDWYKILHFSAGYGNGRVLGNLLGYILSNSPFLASVVRSLVVTLTVYFASKLFSEKKKNFLAISLFVGFLLIATAPLIFGEVYSWISGFSNYTPPIMCTFFCLYCIKNYGIGKFSGKAGRIFCIAGVILAGSASQLFTENATLNSCLLSCFILLVCLIKKNEKRLISFAYVLSSALGALVMIYARLFVIDKDGIYDTVDYSVKMDSIDSLLDTVLFNMKKVMSYLPKCWVLIAILSILALVVLIKSDKPDKFITKIKSLMIAVLIIFPVYSVFASYCFTTLNSFNYQFQLFSLFFSLAFFFLFIIVLMVVGILVLKEHKIAYFFSLVFAVFTAGYMLLLDPINSRGFYYSYILLCVCAVVLFVTAFELVDFSKIHLTKVMSFLTVGLMLILITQYASIYATDKTVNEYIAYRVEQGATEVTICNLTDSEYFHHSYNSARLGYVYYQEEPFDVKFKNATVTDWMNNCYKNGDYKNEDKNNN